MRGPDQDATPQDAAQSRPANSFISLGLSRNGCSIESGAAQGARDMGVFAPRIRRQRIAQLHGKSRGYDEAGEEQRQSRLYRWCCLAMLVVRMCEVFWQYVVPARSVRRRISNIALRSGARPHRAPLSAASTLHP